MFSVTTYAGAGATGAVLSVGTVQKQIDSGGGTMPITNRLSLAIDGVIASLGLALSPDEAKRGKAMSSAVRLAAFDASGAQIVGGSDFAAPVALSVQGDAQNAFRLRADSKSGTSLSILKPTSSIALRYDGNAQASTITVQAAVDGPSASASARFTLRGKEPPPPVGTIYALNLGSHGGRSATVTEYDGKAKGNAAPARTLQLSSKLYARSIAVDAGGKLYVGFFDNQFGFSPSDGRPDGRNVVAVYAPGASGNAQPIATLQADAKTSTTIFPLFMAFDPSGDLVTYGATSVDGNVGDAVLTYAPGASGAAVPLHGWNFASPTIDYAGPTGLAVDAAGNFYFNGALHATLGPSYGVFVAAASDAGNPQTNPSRTIPWDATTQLQPGRTGNVMLDASGEVYVANELVDTNKGTCQGQANAFAAGSGGGVTDVPPLRVLTLDGVFTANSSCSSQNDPRAPFFPSVALLGTTLFAADDFNSAISAYPAGERGAVKATFTIAGSATGLNAPIGLVVTSVSGRAQAGPVNLPMLHTTPNEDGSHE